jgi:uncharacterized membrane protein YvbJ
MLGIKETKEAVTLVIRVVDALVQGSKDGEFGFSDVVLLVSALKNSSEAFRDIKAIPEEIKDLDQFEIQELCEYVKEELKIEKENIHELVSVAIEVGFKILYLKDLVDSLKK